MAKLRLSEVAKSEKELLAALSEADAKTTINAMNLSMADEALLKAEIAGMRIVASRPAQNDALDAGLAALGPGGVGTAMVVTRVMELLKGKQMRYEAPLSLNELAGRLQTRLGDKFRVARLSDSIVVTSLADGSRLCVVRFSVEGEATNVTVSRPNLDEAKSTAANVADEALRRATRPGGFGLENLLNLGKKVISTAIETAGELAEMNAVVDTVETYGVQVENALADLKADLAKDARDEAQKEFVATHCQYCSLPIERGAAMCPQGHPQA